MIPDLNELITKNKIVIFSKPGCKFCKLAASLLEEEGLSYYYCELGEYMDDDDFDDFYQQLVNSTGAKKFPIIYVDGSYIGEYKELKVLMPKLTVAELSVDEDF